MSTDDHERAGVVGRGTVRRDAGRRRWRCAAGVEVAAASGERLGEAADAVAAHLGPAAVGVVQDHAGRVRRRRTRRRAGRRRRCRCAGRRPPRRGSTAPPRAAEGGTTTRKSLPRPWCLLSVMPVIVPHPHDSAAITASRAGASGSSQWGRCRSSVRGGHDGTTAPGGRRTAGCAARSRPRPPSSDDHDRRGGRAAPCSRAPAPRSVTARRARSRPTSSSSPASIIAVTRAAMRSARAGRGQRRPSCTDVGRGEGGDTGTERAERAAAADGDLQRPHDASTVAGVDLGGGDRVERRRDGRAAPTCPARPRGRRRRRATARADRAGRARR